MDYLTAAEWLSLSICTLHLSNSSLKTPRLVAFIHSAGDPKKSVSAQTLRYLVLTQSGESEKADHSQ